MQVSSCCGAQLKEYETPICLCCGEHADVVEDEYNWTKYSAKIVKERIEKHGSITKAIVDMDAQIAALKIEVDVLREMDKGEKHEV